jgi:kynureninase
MIGVDDAQTVAEQLAEQRVFVDWRPGAGLRISPHFFNTDEEVEAAFKTLAGLIA